MLALVFGLLLAALPVLAQDIVYTPIHNATVIYGTWASGAMNVLTGSGFANPAKGSFNYPNTTGVSFSFTEDGYFEIARYRFQSNGTQPSCITGVIDWSHGTYVLQPNGSITTAPLGDGFMQVQDACAAVSNVIMDYNQTELFKSWNIFLDATLGYQLILYQYDGTPLPQQNLYSTTPNMLPTVNLRNSSSASTTATTAASKRELVKRNAAPRTHGWDLRSVVGLSAAMLIAGVSSVLL
ncbi:chaperone for protein-folding within the ER, fungal-domain-containing protein [Rhodofomes roseus]|uniref:Protein ROT1 n=1 Tax=Rhodofomes roseus TaxID=34475 RepID=A0ABQ8K3J1_9APHY|nr:chaperone for protein-folding within the ER, fungal-domain-containing protein [Rhodofomes roseus]KAH9831406.1 chaperone for protein-folding within the ER, fungal-domain-containing protein [Rhodofomes roseus]